MSSISLSMITFNEQHNILPLLNNIYDIFEEIVIADGCSTDKTIKIVDDFKKANNDTKIKLYIIPQEGVRYARTWSQAAQRNLALANCTKDWIFTIDADERLDINARTQMENLISNTTGCYAFAMPTYDYWDKEGQIRVDALWYPNYHYRFWKNDLTIRYSRHQRHCYPMIPKYPDVRKVREEQKEIPYTNIPIHHYHHCPIKRSGFMYRANYKDVRTIQELTGGLIVKQIGLRKRTERELKWQSER